VPPAARPRHQKDTQENPQDSIVNRGDPEGEMPDTMPKQVHLAQDRSEDGKCRHPGANPDRYRKLSGIDSRLELLGMASEDPIPC
jgi:hypothetical protein